MGFRLKNLFSFLQGYTEPHTHLLLADEQVDQQVYRDMPHNMRLMALVAVKNHVLNDAVKHDHFITDHNGHSFIDESKYERETQFIKRILENTSFSPHLCALTSMCALETAIWVKKNKPDHFANPDEKLAFLQKMAEAQTNIFMLGSMDFVAPIASIDEAPQPNWNGWSDFKQEDGAEPVPLVHLSQHYISDPFTTDAQILSTCFHETLHTLLRQISIKEIYGEIDANHPVKKDAELLKAFHERGFVGTSLYKTEYELNPEELLINQAQLLFDLQLLSEPEITYAQSPTLH